MVEVRACAAFDATGSPCPFGVWRQSLLPADVVIEVLFCDVRTFDLHQVLTHLGVTVYMVVPRYEVVGMVGRVGSKVSRLGTGDYVGVGRVDYCRTRALLGRPPSDRAAS
ncbi:alcohol dehydrogenase catalytic domain-containing protein [Lentzea sp. NEAU-D7]|uniref:alcohol dehydrogenase catalytic domain-containing protein n=1 Tax=Lentzea sp. NEAU-D7 TaxID=2994667 RepID=UPI00224B74BC|nr:alcohol dehydrogenase catalytic domain-containing protein [Lentzea sp. NEAU-D7]MCX2954551.1 alcohol dehydrogenase catalytic domain-containing protein [Lentzea sp. NEAU-D7]